MLGEIVNRGRNDLVLLENRRQYMQMYQFVEDPRLLENRLLVQRRDEAIQFARTNLKRNDRIVWFLRLDRIHLILELEKRLQMMEQTEEVGAARRAARKLLIKSMAKTQTTLDRTASELQSDALYVVSHGFKEWVEHAVGMFPLIPEYDAVVWDKQTPHGLIEELGAIEEEWKSELDDRALRPQDGDQIIITFPDGFAWWFLPRASCRDEANAMGHCGNAGSRRGDRILSLRKKLRTPEGEEDAWAPHLTFILNEFDYLGEMKGRSNDKPAARYHPYIIKLLESDYVTGIVGGGYLPENNFSLSDLDERERERLKLLKPGLRGVYDLYEDEGLSPRVKHITGEVLDTRQVPGTWTSDGWELDGFGDAWSGCFSFEDFGPLDELVEIYDALKEDDVEVLTDHGIMGGRLSEDHYEMLVTSAPREVREVLMAAFRVANARRLPAQMKRIDDSMSLEEVFSVDTESQDDLFSDESTRGSSWFTRREPMNFIQYAYEAMFGNAAVQLDVDELAERIMMYYNYMGSNLESVYLKLDEEEDPHSAGSFMLEEERAVWLASETMQGDDDYDDDARYEIYKLQAREWLDKENYGAWIEQEMLVEKPEHEQDSRSNRYYGNYLDYRDLWLAEQLGGGTAGASRSMDAAARRFHDHVRLRHL